MPWVAAPHEAVLQRVADALEDPHRSGAVLVGPDGVGKTLLARLASEKASAQAATTSAGPSSEPPSTVVRWVSGTPSQRVVPFGAFRRLVRLADIGRPAALLRAARDALAHQGTGHDGDLLLVVDDAHDLDTLSATLVYQSVLARSVRLVVTVRSETRLPDVVTALWSDDLLTRVDLDPLDRAQSAALVESALGAPLDVATADEVLRRSRGNPLYLRHLVEGGGLQHVDGHWQFHDENRLPLSGLIDEYLNGLPMVARTVLDYLAVAEPLPRSDLAALAGEQAVGQAEALGAVRSVDTDGDIYAAHPLYADRARAALKPNSTQALRASVVTQLSQQPCDHISDRLRLSTLALDSDNPEPVAATVAAAEQALRLGDLVLTERLARTALDRSDGLVARLTLAQALGWQGRGREAGAVLAAVDPAGLSETEVMSWAVPRAANQFWMLNQPERATAFLQTTRKRIVDPAARSSIDALTATFAMNAGNLRHAVTLATEVLSTPAAGETAVAWAASTAALCSARMGRLGDVEPLAERASAAEHPGLLRFTVGLAQITSLLMAGDTAGAQAVSQRFTDFAELQQPGRAIGEVLLAHVLITKGEFQAAASLLEPAAATLERTGYSWGPLSLMLLATALAQQGMTAAAAKALSRAETRYGTKSALFAPELGLARAWSKTTVRDATGAITAAREAARAAERASQWTVALCAWHDAVRLGDIRAVDQVTRIAAEIDCTVSKIVVNHARALADDDPVGLAAVSDELAAIGMNAAAADAARAAERCGPASR